LHLGHAYSALLAWRRARAAGGRFLLRLEDIDPVRCRPEFAAAIQEDLTWLGLGWDGPVRVQSEHLNDYVAVLDNLRERRLIYPCYCSRADILRSVIAAAPHGPDGGPLYPGTCRNLTETERAARANQPFALRLDMARAAVLGLTFTEEANGMIVADPAGCGDVVLARKDTPTSYHLCVTHDDAIQGVTVVTRGADLSQATHLHRLLQSLMDWPTPLYAHHQVLNDAAGKRLAKRDRAVTLRALRVAGVGADEIRDRLQSGPADAVVAWTGSITG
jgi:glutamyl-Q tRNA(Asp) synthetase